VILPFCQDGKCGNCRGLIHQARLRSLGSVGIDLHREARQLGTFHKANDMGQHLGQQTASSHRIISDILYVFEGETETGAKKRLKAFGKRWALKEPQAVRNFVKEFEHCLVYL